MEAGTMPRAYSSDLRERVVAAVRSGRSRRSVAAAFDVSVSAVVKWMQRLERTGSVAAGRMGGYRPYALAGERVFVLGRLAEKPDLTVSALTAELAERGVTVSRTAVWHFIQHEGLSFKKKPARRRAGPA
jgi:transposase